MLQPFRHQKAYRISLCIAAFTILVSILMPIVHTNSSKKDNALGFLASLCTSNGIVQVNLNSTTEQTEPIQHTSIEISTKCTFCNYLEQNEPVVINDGIPIVYTQLSVKNPSTSQLLLIGNPLSSRAIRSPPQA